MPSAAGIIIATGAMTLGNDFLQAQAPVDPTAPVASKVNFRVIPATAIAAGFLYLLEQASPPVAKSLAWIAFFTAFAFPAEYSGFFEGAATKMSPLQTLLSLTQGSTQTAHNYGQKGPTP